MANYRVTETHPPSYQLLRLINCTALSLVVQSAFVLLEQRWWCIAVTSSRVCKSGFFASQHWLCWKHIKPISTSWSGLLKTQNVKNLLFSVNWVKPKPRNHSSNKKHFAQCTTSGKDLLTRHQAEYHKECEETQNNRALSSGADAAKTLKSTNVESAH